MKDLISFIEARTNKKVNLFKYENQKLEANQELVTFNDIVYVIEMKDDSIPSTFSGYYYLLYQINLDFNIIKKVLCNLYKNIKVTKYDKYVLINSPHELYIDSSTINFIESETYCNTYILNLENIKDIDDFKFKVKLFSELPTNVLYKSSSKGTISTYDLILYRCIQLLSTDVNSQYLINLDKINIIDQDLIHIGIGFIENNLNISKTSSALFIHRNTLIYRLDKIKEIFNLDLRNFKDAMIFYLVVNIYFFNKYPQ